MRNQGVNASGGRVLENGGRVRRRRVTPVVPHGLAPPSTGRRFDPLVGHWDGAVKMTSDNSHTTPTTRDRTAVPRLRRTMTIWEAYATFVISLSMIFVLSPAIDAARQTRQKPPIYSMISAIVPSGPHGLLVAISYAAILAGGLTFGVSQLNRVLPPRRVWVATLVFQLPLLGTWIACGLRGG